MPPFTVYSALVSTSCSSIFVSFSPVAKRVCAYFAFSAAAFSRSSSRVGKWCLSSSHVMIAVVALWQWEQKVDLLQPASLQQDHQVQPLSQRMVMASATSGVTIPFLWQCLVCLMMAGSIKEQSLMKDSQFILQPLWNSSPAELFSSRTCLFQINFWSQKRSLRCE